MKKKVVILDRDGTINKDKCYVHTKENFNLIEGTIKALKKLQEDYLLFIFTNQSGIGRGYYKEEEFHKLNEYMLKMFEKEGIKIHAIGYCPHSPEENCDCRKPKTGAVLPLLKGHNIDQENSYVIGDKTSDIKLAENLGMKSVLVLTGKAGKDKRYKVEPTYTHQNLLEATGVLING